MISVIDRTVSLMKFLPGSQDNKLLTLADTLLEKIKALGQAVQDIRTSIQDTKSQVTAEAVGRLTTPLGRASEALGTVSMDLTAMGQAVDARQAQLAALTQNVITGITLAALVLTLAFLWMAMAQLGAVPARARRVHRPGPIPRLAQGQAERRTRGGRAAERWRRLSLGPALPVSCPTRWPPQSVTAAAT